MVAGDGDGSWVEVDAGERLEERSKVELEGLESGTLVRLCSSMVQLGRGNDRVGQHWRGAHDGQRTQCQLLWPCGG
jgi:hypothetical protein